MHKHLGETCALGPLATQEPTLTFVCAHSKKFFAIFSGTNPGLYDKNPELKNP
jgi:hypothetical protein